MRRGDGKGNMKETEEEDKQIAGERCSKHKNSKCEGKPVPNICTAQGKSTNGALDLYFRW